MTTATTTAFEPTESCAQRLDAADPMAAYRDRFHLPVGADGEPVVYFCGNSLGLMPKTVPDTVRQELDDWASMAVAAQPITATN